jgi:hypothetical protein
MEEHRLTAAAVVEQMEQFLDRTVRRAIPFERRENRRAA